ncbi:MAG: diguanylate cyclase [Bradymonadia bacterium]
MDSPITPAQIAELTSELVCIADTDGNFLWLNDRWEATLGWSKEELRARPFLDLIHPEDVRATQIELESLKQAQDTVNFITRYRCKDGRWLHLDWNVVLTPNKVFVAAARDVTESFIREQELGFRAHLLQMAEGMAQVGHWRVDTSTEVVYWSDQVYAIHGRPKTYQPRLADAIEAYHPDDRNFVQQAVERAIRDKAGFDFERRIVQPGGDIRTVHSKGQVLIGDDGQVASIFGVFQDVTELRRRERELELLNEDINSRMDELSNRTDELELLSELADLLQSTESESEVYDVLSLMMPTLFEPLSGAVYIVPSSKRTAVRSVEWGTPSQETIISISDCWALRRGRSHRLRADRGLICAHHTHRPEGGSVCSVMMAQGDSVGMLVLTAGAEHAQLLQQKARLSDTVADQMALAVSNVRLRESLREQSIRDALTRLYNRRYMDEAIEREFGRAVRRGQPASLVMLDLDHFKRFNDDYGHLTADTLLESFGATLTKLMRQEDVACRWGGEEFLILLPETDAQGAVQVMARVHEHLAKLRVVTATGQPCRAVTASMGVASFPTHGHHPQQVIRAADEALYLAKSQGRNRTVIAAAEGVEASSHVTSPTADT